MNSFDFPRPYEMMVVCSVCVIVSLAITAAISHKHCKSYNAFLIPLTTVVLSYILSDLYFNGWEQVFTINIHDVRAITNGLAAVGLYHFIIKTAAYFRYRKIAKKGLPKKNQRIAAEGVFMDEIGKGKKKK